MGLLEPRAPRSLLSPSQEEFPSAPGIEFCRGSRFGLGLQSWSGL